jgi:glutathione S-transferase
MLTLHDYPQSPHCVRVRIALQLAGLRYRTIAVDLDGDEKKKRSLELTPFGTIPVLVDGRVVIGQSYAAIQWIGEKKPALLGTGANRALVLSWIAASATEIDPPIRRAYDVAFFAGRKGKVLEEALDDVRDALDRVEKARARTRFVAGDRPTIADAAIFPAFWLLQDLADDFARRLPRRRWPRWHAWYQRMLAHPAVAQVIAETEA